MPGLRASAIAVGAILLAAAPLSAQPARCAAKLEKIASKYVGSVTKAIAKCNDAVQKTIDSGSPLGQSQSDICEKSLEKLFDLRAKTLAKCLTACPLDEYAGTGRATSSPDGYAPAGIGLIDLGLAPSAADFPCTVLVAKAESDGFQLAYDNAPSAQANLNAAATAGANAPTLEETALTAPICRVHACSLTSSGGTFVGYFGGPSQSNIPIGLLGHLTLAICSLPGDGFPLSRESRLLVANAAKTIRSFTLLGNTVCTRVVRADGFCDCGTESQGLRNVSLCRDSRGTDGDECSDPVLPGSLAGGSDNGPMHAGYSLPSSTGDCIASVALTMKFVAPGNEGADGVACSDDDVVVTPVLDLAIPFTTGTSTATVFDADGVDGRVLMNTRSGAAVGSCTSLDSSNLSTLTLVGDTPILDHALINDAVMGLTLKCQ